MSVGWISIDRTLLEHNIVGIKKHNGSPNHKNMIFWIWLLTNANYEKTEVFMKGEDVIIDRGQFYGSLRFMEKGTAFSTKEIRKILKDLKKGTLITMENVAGQTMITICNYSLYQKNDDEKKGVIENKKGKPRAQQGHSKGTAKGTKYNKSNNNNNILPGLEPDDEDPRYPEKQQSINPNDIIDLWHNTCPKSPKVLKLSPIRIKHLNARIREDFKTLQDWENYFKQIASRDFLSGDNDRNWKADLDWVINPNNITKVLEGKYQNNGYGSLAEKINHTDKGWEVVVKKYQETGRWHDEWGPEPDMSGNRVPVHILRENGFTTTTKSERKF